MEPEFPISLGVDVVEYGQLGDVPIEEAEGGEGGGQRLRRAPWNFSERVGVVPGEADQVISTIGGGTENGIGEAEAE